TSSSDSEAPSRAALVPVSPPRAERQTAIPEKKLRRIADIERLGQRKQERAHSRRIGMRTDRGDGMLFHRIQGEFLEMPGLRLTPAQAARLWALDRLITEQLLESLAAAGFLFKNKDG